MQPHTFKIIEIQDSPKLESTQLAFGIEAVCEVCGQRSCKYGTKEKGRRKASRKRRT